MSRHYLVLSGLNNRLRQHFSAVIGPFEDAFSARKGGDDFVRDFPLANAYIQPWPDHWQQMDKSLSDQLAAARQELRSLLADMAWLKEFYA